jgi:cytochrome c-type biogenesis protein CcmE
MTRKQKRLSMIVAGLAVLGIAAGLVLFALRNTVAFFVTPSEIAERQIAPGQRIRLGGAVEIGSLKRQGTTAIFTVTDSVKTIEVQYTGLLPDLFREGQCIVAEGRINGGGVFEADTVLAKHDENYMPPEVASSLKAKGAEHMCEIKS